MFQFVLTLICIYSCFDHHVTFGFIIHDHNTLTVINRPTQQFVRHHQTSSQQKQFQRKQSVDNNILFVPSLSVSTKQSSCLYSSISDIINNLPSSEDFNYISQNLANQVASISMKDLGSGGPTNYIKSLPLMYGAGLLTSASPCVWGLLPLTMSYISQAAGEREDHETTIPTLAFAAGLATIFCTLGFMAVELGGIFGSSTSSDNGSMILSTLSNGICLIMGFKLLDLINIRFPSFIGRDPLGAITKSFNNMINPDASNSNSESGGIISKNPKLETMIFLDATGRIMTYDEMQSRKENTNCINESNDNNEDIATATKLTNKRNERGSLIRTFLLGGSSALVASPCATPVLTSILAYVASATNPFVGALLLLMYTAGYSTPLLIVAATGGQALENLRQKTSSDNNDKNPYSRIGPWVTPITGGILLWYGTDGILHTLIGDPSLAGLNIYT